MSRTRVTYVIAYDIADPTRLRRVHSYMRKWAVPVQYSVFVAELSQNQLDALLAGVARLIHHFQDDVRCYALPTETVASRLGRQYLPPELLGSALAGVRWEDEAGLLARARYGGRRRRRQRRTGRGA